MENILIVEDEKDIAEMLAFNLRRDSYFVKVAYSGEDALVEVSKFIPDLVILDLMLPGMDGLEICRRLKSDKRFTTIPILMVTARSEDEDVVLGLETGADDYITKPFSPKVLLARVRAMLRRSKTRQNRQDLGILTAHGIEIDVHRHRVTLNGREVDLSATEFAILEFLVRNPGWVFSRNQIIKAVKGEDHPVTERSVDVQIVALRKKMGEFGDLIETVRGIGYRLKEEEVEN